MIKKLGVLGLTILSIFVSGVINYDYKSGINFVCTVHGANTSTAELSPVIVNEIWVATLNFWSLNGGSFVSDAFPVKKSVIPIGNDGSFQINRSEIEDYDVMILVNTLADDPKDVIIGLMAIPSGNNHLINIPIDQLTSNLNLGTVTANNLLGESNTLLPAAANAFGNNFDFNALSQMALIDDTTKSVINAYVNYNEMQKRLVGTRINTGVGFSGLVANEFTNVPHDYISGYNLHFRTNIGNNDPKFLYPPQNVVINGQTYGPNNPVEMGISPDGGSFYTYFKYNFQGNNPPPGYWVVKDGNEQVHGEADFSILGGLDSNDNPIIMPSIRPNVEEGKVVSFTTKWWTKKGGTLKEINSVQILERVVKSYFFSTDGAPEPNTRNQTFAGNLTGDTQVPWDVPFQDIQNNGLRVLVGLFGSSFECTFPSYTASPTVQAFSQMELSPQGGSSPADISQSLSLPLTVKQINHDSVVVFGNIAGYAPADDPPADDPPADDEIIQDNTIVASGITVSNNSKYSGVFVYEGGTVNNYATLSDLDNHGTVNGGIITGNVINSGTLNKVDLAPEALIDNKGGTIYKGNNEGQVFGGILKGDISNYGIISGSSPNNRLEPEYVMTVRHSASVLGGRIGGNVINMGRLHNVTFEENTMIFFPHWSDGGPGELTGTITFRGDAGVDSVIEIPTGAFFPDPDTITDSGLVLNLQYILDYAWDQGWFDAKTLSLMHAKNRVATLLGNNRIPAIPDNYFLIGGAVLSETGSKSINAAEFLIPYEPWEIPEKYSDNDLAALVYDYVKKQWVLVPSENTEDNKLKINTSFITAYAVVIEQDAKPGAPEEEDDSGSETNSGGSSSSSCFISTLF